MEKFFYIHGFNGSPCGHSARALKAILGDALACAAWDCAKPFWECLENLEQQALAWQGGRQNRICVLGTSLGGFYAMQLRKPNISQAIAWNPVIYPAAQLALFVGENTRFFDSRKWLFTKAALLSYARAPDGRQWRNFYADGLASAPQAAPRRNVILGRDDTLLEPSLAFAHWQEHADISFIEAGHQVGDYSHLQDFL